jgi:hypothetical protein
MNHPSQALVRGIVDDHMLSGGLLQEKVRDLSVNSTVTGYSWGGRQRFSGMNQARTFVDVLCGRNGVYVLSVHGAARIRNLGRHCHGVELQAKAGGMSRILRRERDAVKRPQARRAHRVRLNKPGRKVVVEYMGASPGHPHGAQGVHFVPAGAREAG